MNLAEARATRIAEFTEPDWQLIRCHADHLLAREMLAIRYETPVPWKTMIKEQLMMFLADVRNG